MRAIDRRRMLAVSASAVALGAHAAAAAEEKKKVELKGNLKQSVVFWCFNVAGEKWDVNKTYYDRYFGPQAARPRGDARGTRPCRACPATDRRRRAR